MQHLDYYLFTLINNMSGHNKLLDSAMVIFAKWGVVVYGAILLYLFFCGQEPGVGMLNRKNVVKGVLAACIALLINQIIGFIYIRPRPFTTHTVNLLIDRSPDPSFPSDHAAGAGSLSLTVFSEHPYIGTLMFCLTLLLIISRVYVGTHYPLDVLGGVFTGFLGSLLAEKLWPLCNSSVTKVLELWELLTKSLIARVTKTVRHQE